MGDIGPIMLLALVCLSVGCYSKVPPLSAILAPPLPPDVISNFESGSTDMNPALQGSSSGYWLDNTYPSYNVINSMFVVSNTVPDATDSSKYAIHIYGTLTDKGDCTYPAFELQGNFKNDPSSPYLDISSFTGIQFQMNIGADDTCPQRLFGVGTAETVNGIAGGTCTPASNCNNDFWSGTPGSNGPYGGVGGSGWSIYSYTWAQLQPNPYYGPVLNPTTLSGTNLTTALCLLWKFGANNNGQTTCGGPVMTYTVDFWIDNVQFLP